MGLLTALALILMGLAMGLILMGVVRACERKPSPVVMSINNMECRLCHAPQLTTYKKYRAYHRALRQPAQADLLAELVRP